MLSLFVDIPRKFGIPLASIPPPRKEKIFPKPRSQDHTTLVDSTRAYHHPYRSIFMIFRGISEGLSRIIRKAGVTVHINPTNTIYSILVAPKDKPNKWDRPSSWFTAFDARHAPPSSSHYVGETERAERPLNPRWTYEKVVLFWGPP